MYAYDSATVCMSGWPVWNLQVLHGVKQGSPFSLTDTLFGFYVDGSGKRLLDAAGIGATELSGVLGHYHCLPMTL
jgi:hypothetical protein